MSKRFWYRLRKFADESASSTVEFCCIFPLFIAIIFASIEGGLLMTRYMMVERGVDVTMRAVRLGKLPGITYDEFQKQICTNVGVVSNCAQNLVVATEILSEGETVDPAPADCFDRTATEEELKEFNPADGFAPGNTSQIVVIKICAIVDPLLANFGLSNLIALDKSGGFPIRTKTAFLHEPY
ncbi:MAG: TadE/TadG family type IV pilus assembly protein [Pseudomonadota bacterium]